MGVAVSKYSELTANELLARFCSGEVVCANDPFWNQMLAFNINPPANSEEQLIFDSSTEPLLHKFLQNNPQTGNLGSLVQVFVTRATELLAAPNSDNVMLAWQTFNALFVIRAVSKYLVEMVPEYELCRHLDVQPKTRSGLDTPPKPDFSPENPEAAEIQTSPKMNGSESRVEILIDALIGLIIDIPVTDNTYYLHLECINTLLVLMSAYMFAGVHGQARLVETSLIFRTLFQGRYGMHAPLLVKTLLNNLANMQAAPPAMFGTGAHGGSVLINIASGLWNMLTLNTAARHTLYSHPPLDRRELSERLKREHPLANQACLLLLALANHCIGDDNLYRAALLRCEDATPLSGELTLVATSTDSPLRLHTLHKREHPLANQACLLLLALANHCIGDDNLYRAALLRCEDATPLSGELTLVATSTDSPLRLHTLHKREHPLANQACLLLLALANHCIGDDNLYRAALLRCEDATPLSGELTLVATSTDSPLRLHTLHKREHPLANQACLLLLALANHCIGDDNLYRAALLRCEDATPLSGELTLVATSTDSPLRLHTLHKREHPLANQACLLLLALANHCIGDDNLYRAALLRCEDATPLSGELTLVATSTDSPLRLHTLHKREHPLANQACLLLLALANHCIGDDNLYRAALLRCEDATPLSGELTLVATSTDSPLRLHTLHKREHPLANQACLLLLALANHCIGDDNLYRAALLRCEDATPLSGELTLVATSTDSPLRLHTLHKREHPLANQACLLLLALANHCIGDDNLYRAALLRCEDATPLSGELTLVATSTDSPLRLHTLHKREHPLANQACLLLLALANHCIGDDNLYRAALLRCEDATPLSGELTLVATSTDSPLRLHTLHKREHPLANQACLLLLALANHCIGDDNLYRAALLRCEDATPLSGELTLVATSTDSPLRLHTLHKREHPLANQACLLLLALANHCIGDDNLYRAALLRCEDATPLSGELTLVATSTDSPLRLHTLHKREHPLANQACLLLLALANHCIGDDNLYRAALLRCEDATPLSGELTLVATSTDSPLRLHTLHKREHPLANQACLLLLALANHCIGDDNLYRAALLRCEDATPLSGELTLVATSTDSPLRLHTLHKREHPLANQACLLLLALANHCIGDDNLYRAALLRCEDATPLSGELTLVATSTDSPLRLHTLHKREHPLANQACLLLLALANHCIGDDNLYRAALLRCEDATPLSGELTLVATSTDSPLRLHTLHKREHPLANQACLLLLALANHCIGDDNLYRAALLRCEDATPLSGELTLVATSTDSPLRLHTLHKREHPLANQACLLLLALANHCIGDDNLYRAALLRCEDATPLSGELTLVATSTDSPLRLHTLHKREHPLANQACLLLLALANHCIGDDNLYRAALLRCEDATPLSESATTPLKDGNGPGAVTPPRIDMTALHKALCATVGCEHSTLLLYVMLHSCDAYKRHVSNVTHIDQLIIPILQVLYNAPESSSHHIYMSLIVLLILTEDDALIKNVHLIMLKNLTWYTERAISEISLGGLMVLVIVRALQYNMARVRDKYLHTNCLAAIANMSCEFRNLHPYVAQRLISLFETLTKRRARLCSEIEGGDINNLELPHHAEEKTEEIMDHISVLDEVLRMLLEIINSCLTHQLSNNLNVVYALLHKRQLFEQHRHHHITQNIEMVIGYFSTRLQRVQEGAGGDLGVTEVLACIKKGAEQWSSDRLKKFPDLKFRYVEEERPEEFFTPYVWGLITGCGGVYWASECGARAVTDLLAC